MVKKCLTILLVLLNLTIKGQSTLFGTVKDSETGEPIFGANVFIENSTLGSTTDPDGNFVIENIRGSFQNVVVSHLAYQSKSIPLKDRRRIDFKLKPKTTQLSDIQIEQTRDRKWKRLYNQFENEFIGSSENAKNVSISNPWVMELSKNKSGELNGYSHDLLEIENRSTGYRINFLVQNFTRSGEEVKYIGKPFFIPLQARSKEEELKWIGARKKTYLGSRQHFLYALANDRVFEEGFLMYNADFDQRDGVFKTQDRVQAEDVLIDGTLSFKRFLKVIYTKEKPEQEFVKAFSSSTRVDLGNFRGNRGSGNIQLENRADSKNQISYLFVKTSRGVQLSKDGVFKNPEYVLEYGYWSWERIAELMPYEYHLDLVAPTKKAKPKPISQITVAKAPIVNLENTNGFDISNASVPIEDIIKGAPSRNAIPAINSPKFKSVSEITWLKENSQVIGFEHHGVQRAYPLEILNRHEIVNDSFGDLQVAITYCPLCGSGMAFNRIVADELLSFGISGLLLNNNVLMYDQTTNSLWSQIESVAITGINKGKKLEELPVIHMKWSEWKDKYPKSEVLTRETGYDFTYAEAAYVGYDRTDEIPFPIMAKSDDYRPKELVIGVSLDGQHKAYPLRLIKKKKGSFEDLIGRRKVSVEYSKKSHTAQIYDETGHLIPSTRLYWFAWYAFYPETEVYK